MGSKWERRLAYLGNAEKDCSKMPKEAQELFVAALEMARMGDRHEDAKPFKHHGSGVFEVVSAYRGDAYRAIYTVRYPEIVFVIHIFKKKSKRGSETPKEDKKLIVNRLKRADEIYKENYGKKSSKR